jgi:hypothetical protein
VFKPALLSKYEAYGERVTGLAVHEHSRITLQIHQHCNPRFGHFTRTVPRGRGRGKGYGDAVILFLERTNTATLDVAAEIMGLPAASLPRHTRFEMSRSIRYGGMGTGDVAALADAARVGAAGLAAGSTIRVLTSQDALLRGEPTTMFRWSQPCTNG